MLTAEKYRKMLTAVREKRLANLLIIFSKIATVTVYVLYPSALILLLLTKSPDLLKDVLVPFISFLAVTVVRKILNRQRPYEKFGVEPLSSKKRQGLSMPSRHTFSAFVIATVMFFIIPPIGVISAVCGVIIAVTRVLLGVHYPSDVTVGAIVGIAFGVTVIFF